MKHKLRPILIAAAVLLGVWLAVWVAWAAARGSKMTAEKLNRWENSLNFARLSAAERAQVIQQFADKVNSLSVDERRRWRMEQGWKDRFAEMTENERSQFIEATLPTGFKQALNTFEQLPEARRKKVIDDAMKRLKESGEQPAKTEAGQDTDGFAATDPPPLSPELEKQVRAIGLKTFYAESSAQTKAELAPLLEELQHEMQTGRNFR